MTRPHCWALFNVLFIHASSLCCSFIDDPHALTCGMFTSNTDDQSYAQIGTVTQNGTESRTDTGNKSLLIGWLRSHSRSHG
jgi:hypothetical protein